MSAPPVFPLEDTARPCAALKVRPRRRRSSPVPVQTASSLESESVRALLREGLATRGVDVLHDAADAPGANKPTWLRSVLEVFVAGRAVSQVLVVHAVLARNDLDELRARVSVAEGFAAHDAAHARGRIVLRAAV